MTPPSYARGLVLATVVVALLAACGSGPAPPPEPESAPETERWLRRAHDAERQRRYDRARRAYERAVEAAPDERTRAHAAREFARALLFWGELEAGAAALEQVVRLRPDHAASWHDLGIVRHELGDRAGAERALRRAAALAPRDPRPRIALGALLWDQRRYAEALAEYDALAELELPGRVREQVDWARRRLRRRLRER